VTKELEHQFIAEFERHQNVIHKICRIYTNHQDAHNDLFQEITIQLWKAYPKFRREAKFSTWMYRIGLNTAITLYRKRQKRIRTQAFDTELLKLEATEYDANQEAQLTLLYKAIHQLSDIDKALVFLYLEEKPYKEISETLGMSEVNARVKMNRIKKRLKKLLNP
jgi:RNA polymerase sigma-70 factor (ECF subfamily)